MFRSKRSEGIVDELASLCADSNLPLTELLRKAKFITLKLSLKQASEWIEHESNGYTVDSFPNIPKYRFVACHIKQLNPFRGFQDVVFVGERPPWLKLAPILASCGYLENISSSGDDLTIPFSDRENAWLWSHDTDYRPLNLPGHKLIGAASLRNILNTVRTRLMEWAIALSNDGVKGEGHSFTSEDKEKAINVTNGIFNSGNMSFVGDTSNGSNVAVNQASSVSIDISKVSDFIKSYDQISPSWEYDGKAEIDRNVDILRHTLQNDPSNQSKLKDALSAIKRLTEGVGAGLIANGIYSQIVYLMR